MRYLRFIILAGIVLPFSFLSKSQDIGGNIISGYEERKAKAITALNQFSKRDTARVNALINVIATALIQKQRQELLPYCEEAMTISRSLHHDEGLARCYIWMGHYVKARMDRSRAHAYYDSAINLGESYSGEMFKKTKADAHRGKAWIYSEQENYYAALNQFFEALKYYEGRNATTAMHLYTVITNIYSRVNDLPQAIVYAVKNTELAEQDPDHAMKEQAWLSLAEIYVRNNQLKLAEKYLNKMKPYMPDPVQLMVNAGYYMNRGLIFYKQQLYDSALLYYRQAFEVSNRSNHNLNKTASLYYLSGSALKAGKYKLAKKYAHENLLQAENTHSKTGKINALLNLSDYYHAVGNPTEAYTFLSQAAALKDSLQEEANIVQINALAALYEADKKEKEIIQLQSEKKIQAASVKQKSLLNILFIASIIVMLFFGYLGYLNFKKNQKIAKQEQDLQAKQISELEKNRQLETIGAMLRGQEEERGRIAKELHDGLGSLLSGTKMSFMHVKETLHLSPHQKTQFDKSLSMLDNTIGDLRKVAQNLMPEALVRFGLHESLRDFCEAMQTSAGISIVYLRYGEKRTLGSTAEVYIYRIIQELVNNAVKHSDATEIIAQLTMSADKTNITVEDNGKGFEKANLNGVTGSGMGNIKYRVDYLNGSLDIVSSPGHGTSVNIQFMM